MAAGLAASFSFTPASPAVGQSVQFTDTSTGGPTAWFWNFGDGTSSTSRNPAHAFSSAGSFNVSLTASGGSGFEDLQPDRCRGSRAGRVFHLQPGLSGCRPDGAVLGPFDGRSIVLAVGFQRRDDERRAPSDSRLLGRRVLLRRPGRERPLRVPQHQPERPGRVRGRFYSHLLGQPDRDRDLGRIAKRHAPVRLGLRLYCHGQRQRRGRGHRLFPRRQHIPTPCSPSIPA